MGGRISRARYEADLRAGKKDLFDITSSKDALIALLLIGGTLTVLHFAPWLLAAALPLSRAWKDSPKNRQRFSNMFSYMKKRGYIEIESRKGDVHIRLTPVGRKRARHGYGRVLEMQSSRPAKWDGKWRVILFDVPTSERIKRDAFRKLIKRLGAMMIQKSVWVYPFDCSGHIALLKSFFELDGDQVKLLLTDSIGNDRAMQKHFRI